MAKAKKKVIAKENSCVCAHKVGLTAGLFAALIHAVWALLVSLGVGQNVINMIFPLHFLNVVYQVQSFNLVTAIMLIIMAFLCGYIMGWVFTAIYKKV